VQHVGIYAGERQFLHVSTRAGVMLSSLSDPYWAPRLRAAVRPLLR
jgi:cell wall-associated NlpC family hydrolase